MSYQVLARKWRPATFAEMVGQAHVQRALINALDQQRLHHAYLFTGTRGVGKTTIARLVAKSLNCERGISSNPCGRCSACTEIAEGRFVDLIEVDAASRTKVEDTRELLENVLYAPTRGRFKVYLIDEVHMLSTSSFNALLKTLEEPPAHVKFLLATTDPQKLPVTVLSRCLQFNLKNMGREPIVNHLKHILNTEKIGFDEASLWAIADAADGSMRDALSLTDQAIALSGGMLTEKDVAAMLGTVDLRQVVHLVQALLAKDLPRLMALIAKFDEYSPDYRRLLSEVMATLHRIAIAQAMPAAMDDQQGDRDIIMQLAAAAAPEDIHLYYQIAGKSQEDMMFAPTARAGVEMALLRMLAFSQTPPADDAVLPPLAMTATPPVNAEVHSAAERPANDKPDRASEADQTSQYSNASAQALITAAEATSEIPRAEAKPSAPLCTEDPKPALEQTQPAPQSAVATQAAWPEVDREQEPQRWWQVLVYRCGLQGMAKTIFVNSQWQSFDGTKLTLLIAPDYRKILTDQHLAALQLAIGDWLPDCDAIDYRFAEVTLTPRQWHDQQVALASEQALASLQKDPFVMTLINKFNARLETATVAPTHSPIPSGA